jgi:surface antigen
VAAALAIVVVGHQWSLRHAEQALEAREAQIVALADQAVQDALEHALSGAAVSVSDPKMASTVSITPTRTYRSETKHWCREFVEDLVIDGERVTRFGLACRETDGGWRRVQTQQPGSMPPPVSSRTL